MIAFAAITVLMLLLSAFFSGIEIAFLSADRFRLALKEQAGERAAVILGRFFRNNTRVITTILVGNNLALVLYGTSASRLLEPLLFGPLNLNRAEQPVQVLLLETLFSTAVVLFFAEYLPKAIFRTSPNRLLTLFARVMLFFYRALYPIVWVASSVSNRIIRSVSSNQRVVVAERAFTKQDLYKYVSGWIAQSQKQELLQLDPEVFLNALEFNEVRVKEFMVPRTEIQGVEFNDELAVLREKFAETELSRLIVFEENLDHPVGYVHISGMFQSPQRIEDILLELILVPETMPAHMLLREFNTKGKSVAAVVDEFGGTAGLVTIEDLVEVIFGEIEDEHDEEEEDELVAEQLNATTWQFSARLEIDDLNEEYDLNLPEDDEYNTLGGLFMEVAERIPKPNDSVKVGSYRLTVLSASRNKINLIRLQLEEELLPEED